MTDSSGTDSSVTDSSGTGGPLATGPRLVLDAAACEGHGICALCCPERIALDAWGFPEVDPEPLASRRDLARARRVVAACPEGALSLEGPTGVAADPARTGGRSRRPWAARGRPVSHGTGNEGGWSR